MRIVGHTNDSCQFDSLVTLINEVYRDYPEYAQSRASRVATALDPMNPFFQYGTYQGFLAYSGGRPVAHACAIIDRRMDPAVGLIGFFESLPDKAYAQAVLREAIDSLAGQGVRAIRGPVDLTTWNGFRVSYPEESPPFSLEPFTRAYYRSFFHEQGFSVAQRNVSTLHGADQVSFQGYRPHFEALQARGFVFERAEEHRLPAVLPQVHRLVLQCFADTWSFVPISFEEFQYTFADPSQPFSEALIYVAYNPAGEPVGFCFGSLDWPHCGKRAIVKSVAVVPMQRRLQVARALLYCVYLAGRERGASEFILSTMRDDNKQVRALTWGARKTYRQYEVYQLALEGRCL